MRKAILFYGFVFLCSVSIVVLLATATAHSIGDTAVTDSGQDTGVLVEDPQVQVSETATIPTLVVPTISTAALSKLTHFIEPHASCDDNISDISSQIVDVQTPHVDWVNRVNQTDWGLPLQRSRIVSFTPDTIAGAMDSSTDVIRASLFNDVSVDLRSFRYHLLSTHFTWTATVNGEPNHFAVLVYVGDYAYLKMEIDGDTYYLVTLDSSSNTYAILELDGVEPGSDEFICSGELD